PVVAAALRFVIPELQASPEVQWVYASGNYFGWPMLSFLGGDFVCSTALGVLSLVVLVDILSAGLNARILSVDWMGANIVGFFRSWRCVVD
ncbi:hypothetical protein Dimus_036163, partial [Dionaea muscipula]